VRMGFRWWHWDSDYRHKNRGQNLRHISDTLCKYR